MDCQTGFHRSYIKGWEHVESRCKSRAVHGSIDARNPTAARLALIDIKLSSEVVIIKANSGIPAD